MIKRARYAVIMTTIIRIYGEKQERVIKYRQPGASVQAFVN